MPSREPDLSWRQHITCYMLPLMTEPAKKLVTMPADLLEEVKKEAAEQGVSANAFIVATLAGAVSYRMPDEFIADYLRRLSKSAVKQK